MSLTTEGINAERKARELLKKRGWQIQQIDWIGERNGKWIVFEIKERELFEPPPFTGTGLDKSQLFLRTKLLKELGLRTILVVFIKKSTDIYWQYLDILEKGKFFDTMNSIRIYPIENFVKIDNDF